MKKPPAHKEQPMSDWDAPKSAPTPPQEPPRRFEPAPAAPSAEEISAKPPQFVARAAKRTLQELIVPQTTMESLLDLIERIAHHETLYERWGLKQLDPNGGRTVLNLYGPPGTGKTLAAEAIAHHLKRPLLDVNYAELESKYVGETAKNIVAAFETAREQGAVLFFDEADSVLGKRLVEVKQSADHGVNQSRSVMLKQLEAFDGVVIFATNMAKNYDGAFVRRILGHVRFDLPGAPERERLWERYLLPELPREDEVTAKTLAELGAGLSGGELLNALLGAASKAVRRSERRLLTMDDMRHHLETAQRSRREIGDYDYGDEPEVTTSSRIITADELPPEARAKLDALPPHDDEEGPHVAG
jgi:SpoVK/Ycf46/Vps4 family AAA+-type ATPase